MLTLYQRTDCPFCWKVRLALGELGIDYCKVDTLLGEKHPEVLRLSPTGTVPVLQDEEVVIWESGVMIDYLDSRYGPGRLIPPDPAAAARVRSLHAYSDKVVGQCLRQLVFEKRSRAEQEWDREIIAEGERQWRGCQGWLEQALGEAEFFGASFGAADCALAARCGVAEAYGAGVTEDFPGLQKWYRAVKSRHAWVEAYPTSFIRAG